MHGQFVWYELTTPAVGAAIKFYPRFTGWGTQRFDKDYTMWTTGGAPSAGVFKLSPEMKAQGIPPNWMPYIESDDVDATLQKVAALGGTVMHGPADVPGAGRFGVVQDPQGAVFGVYKSTRPSKSWNGTPQLGGFSWHELMTTDYKKAADFYGALFGWAENGAMDMGNGDMYSMFGHGDAMYGGMFNRPAEMASAQPFWLLYINVKDVAKAVTAATKAGATVMRPQMDIPGGSIAILADPQGAAFAVHQLSTAPAATPPSAKKPAARKAVGKAKKAVKTARAAVGKAFGKAVKAVKGAVKRVRGKVAPVKAKAKGAPAKVRGALKSKPKAKAAAKKVTAQKLVAKKVVAKKGPAKTRSKPKVAPKRAAAPRRGAAKRKR